MSPRLSDLLNTARAWAAKDCDADDRRATLDLIVRLEQQPDDSAALTKLERGFSTMLEFGTAGMRGEVMPGPSGMNRAVVRLTTRAVADHLRQHLGDGVSVVLGYDARLSSRALADEAAGTLVAAGLRVRYFEAPAPTPVIAYAALHEAAAAAIVVTASHNPKQDNGYKLYGSNGIQIVSPVDEAITELRQALPSAAAVPWVPRVLDGEAALAQPVPEALIDDYFEAIASLLPPQQSAAAASHAGAERAAVRIVYTPVHGVGGAYVERALRDAGFSQVHVVPEQAEPDGSFPTAPNPNPERPGVLDAALALAERLNAHVVLANDPDADRLAVAVPTANGVRKLNGNQVGVLLADSLLAAGSCARPLVVSSIVSTPMLAAIAAKHGARAEATLTGFKWLWTAALELSAVGYDFVLGFEEALGYSIGKVVRDKDGISAALVFASLVASWQARGETPLRRLERLYAEHGLWVSTQLAVERPPPHGHDEIQGAVQTLADTPPEALDGVMVTGVVDYRTGGASRPRWLGETPLLELQLGAHGRVLVRPSGTEPLLKIYVDLRATLAAGEDVWQREARLVQRADDLARVVRRYAGI